VQDGGRSGRRGRRLTPDASRILAAQGTRALAYGLGSVLVGVTLADRGYSDAAVGAVLAALLAGNALASLLLARYGDRIGRRRCYRVLLVAMALAGTVFALTAWPPALIAAALTGTVSTDVVESGPFTSLEQAMLPHAAADRDPTALFGTYNTVATIAGSLGALTALVGSSPQWLLCYPAAAAAGLVAVRRISPAVEVGHDLTSEPRPPLHRSRGIVARLSGLFALDSLGGGFVPQTFIAYIFTRKYGASPQVLAVLFFAIGVLQALSFQAAVRIAARLGLLRTMVFTHLPSNVLLAAIAFAPTLETAIALLLARFAFPDGRPHAAGLRRRSRRSERADCRGRVHEHRAHTHPPSGAAPGRCSAPRRPRRTFPRRRRAQDHLRHRALGALPQRPAGSSPPAVDCTVRCPLRRSTFVSVEI
jgi:MFS family permease